MVHNGSYLDLAPCFYFSCSDDGILLETNGTLCSGLGFEKDELKGKRVDAIFTVATRIFYQTHFFPLLKMHGHAEEIFITIKTKDAGQIPLLVNAVRKEVNGVPVNMYVGIVVHHRKKFEEELIAAKKAAEEALKENTALIRAEQELQKHMEQLDRQMLLVSQQNEELRQFNRVITHDLQEPIRKLALFVNMLQESREAQSLKPLSDKIIRIAGQMRAVTLGLQQYVWLTDASFKQEKVDLGELINKAQHQLAQENPNVHLVVEATDLAAIQADSAQLYMLLYQLLSNSIRFRKPGKEAFVKLAGCNLMLNRFQNLEGKYKYADFLKLQFSDSGIGFNSRYNERVFGLFQRLHPESGLGIGLSLCKKIIENHQGKIFIESVEGKGTTVTVLLPVEGVE